MLEYHHYPNPRKKTPTSTPSTPSHPSRTRFHTNPISIPPKPQPSPQAPAPAVRRAQEKRKHRLGALKSRCAPRG
ncbi:predicted protein [Plenodomus lingam JN3]|uniref:Uncharacterized protein n=1 Tax=Leptosphaeria maculans (strain JN3 / isolate v23.1.3 / race Av1-4-5-6-7-8) TaxID=985895 RepID=E5A7Q9_LEPMJ|nr:predicted protein [Plenodomus lingam JN3]CBX99654.1 predicted protein [Plenodomus lingam JN3]